MPHFKTNNIETFYERGGNGTPLLLIHGLGSSTRDWERQMVALAPFHEIIACDVRGHGRSGKPPGPYSILQFADDIAALVRGLGVGPVHVAGLSMGGMIAFQLALDAPDIVRSIVIINSGPELVLKTMAHKLYFLQRKVTVNLFGMKRFGKMLAKALFPNPDQRGFRKTMAERWAENDKTAYLTAMEALIGWSVMERLPEIGVPALILASDRDYTPPGYKQKYAERMPESEVVVIENSRHISPVDSSARVNREVALFLSKVEKGLFG